MNIEKLNEVLKTINVAGIKEIIISKADGKVMVYGADSTEDDIMPSIVVISEADSSIVDVTMGISRLPVLLNRINLFDLEKTKVSCDTTDTFTRVITVKEGRRKVSYTFTNPDIINVPTDTIEDNVSNIITLSKEYINGLSKVNQAMSAEVINITGINNEITFELSDGDGDSFTDVVSDECTGDFSFNWQTRSVLKMLKHAIKKDDYVELGIGELGILYIEVDNLLFMIMPQVL